VSTKLITNLRPEETINCFDPKSKLNFVPVCVAVHHVNIPRPSGDHHDATALSKKRILHDRSLAVLNKHVV
jgi:hypothetical protein